MSSPDVLIVGAGPTGLALALWLGRAGVPIRIIDRAPAPGMTSRAIVVHARILEFYRQLGIARQVVERGMILDRLRLRANRQTVATLPVGDIGAGLSPYPFILTLPQDDHEKLLIELLQQLNVQVERDTELTGLTETPVGIEAVLRQSGKLNRFATRNTCAAVMAPTAQCASCWASDSQAAPTSRCSS